MNKHFKVFLHRGLIFGGFGPIIVGIVYLILDGSIENFSLGGCQTFIAILSTYLLAFVHAGASVFNQIEDWSLAKSLFCHFGLLYIAYLLCYVSNTWIPFDPLVILIFSGIFVVGYFAVWLSVLAVVKATERRMNERIGKK